MVIEYVEEETFLVVGIIASFLLLSLYSIYTK